MGNRIEGFSVAGEPHRRYCAAGVTVSVDLPVRVVIYHYRKFFAALIGKFCLLWLPGRKDTSV